MAPVCKARICVPVVKTVMAYVQNILLRAVLRLVLAGAALSGKVRLLSDIGQASASAW